MRAKGESKPKRQGREKRDLEFIKPKNRSYPIPSA